MRRRTGRRFNQDAAWDALRPLGSAVVAYLAEAYATVGRGESRTALVYRTRRRRPRRADTAGSAWPCSALPGVARNRTGGPITSATIDVMTYQFKPGARRRIAVLVTGCVVSTTAVVLPAGPLLASPEPVGLARS